MKKVLRVLMAFAVLGFLTGAMAMRSDPPISGGGKSCFSCNP